MEKSITCIICPVGCEIQVTGEPGRVETMRGHACKRGEEYARNEFIHPVRILTSTVRVEGGDAPLVPVRSQGAIPKELQMQCMACIRTARAEAPVKCYDVLIPDILGTGVDIVATGDCV